MKIRNGENEKAEKRGGPGGHHKTRNGKVIQLLHGNGCKDWKDCFTCPKKKCNYNG